MAFGQLVGVEPSTCQFRPFSWYAILATGADPLHEAGS